MLNTLLPRPVILRSHPVLALSQLVSHHIPTVAHTIRSNGWNRKITSGVGRNRAMTKLCAHRPRNLSNFPAYELSRSAIFSRVMFSSSALYQPFEYTDGAVEEREGGRIVRDEEEEERLSVAIVDHDRVFVYAARWTDAGVVVVVAVVVAIEVAVAPTVRRGQSEDLPEITEPSGPQKTEVSGLRGYTNLLDALGLASIVV